LDDGDAALFAAAEVDLATGESSAKKLRICDADPNDLPERMSMQANRSGCESQQGRQDRDRR
jgi:hypothetical protein